MAFDKDNYAPIGGQATLAPSIYSYKTNDLISEVAGAGYFGVKAFELEMGDQIYCLSGDGPFIMTYVSNENPAFILSPLDPSLIQIERLLDGASTTIEQNPTGTTPANAIQIEFGPDVNTPSDPVSLTSSGALSINQSGTYRIKVAIQFGRTGGAGTSELLFRVLVDGAQAGRSVHASIQNSNVTSYFENDTWIFLPAGTVLTFEVMRDSTGNNSGGLFGFVPTADPNAWEVSPSASIRVERWA